MPGSASTPEATSTAYGCTAAIAPATLSAVSPPERIAGIFERRWAARLQSHVRPRAAAHALGGGVEQVEVGVEALERLQVGAAGDARGLDDLRARAARDLVGERRALVAVQLHVREPDRLGGVRDLVERRVDEHADELGLAPHAAGDPGRDGLLDRALGAAARG